MIEVHGLLGAPTSQLRDAAAAADFVVGGVRLLDALGVEPERRIVLGALRLAVEKVAALPNDTRVVVVASGDPLYFGVVRSLRAAGFRPNVVPAVSSIAAAFAAVGLPWDDAAVVSAHGRPLEAALRRARTASKVAVFTSKENGIRELAAGLEDLDRWFVLAERLGEDDERVRVLSADEAKAVEPAEPNVVLILQRHPSEPDAPWPGVEAGPVPPIRERADLQGTDEQPVIGQVTGGSASLARADHIDKILGVTTNRYEGATTGLPRAWSECDLIISHLALGATTRIVAPLLESKTSDPGVVVVDEAGRFAVPLVGGHAGGANDLARRIADGLGATAVLTTATDSLGLPALDTLGWPYSGAVAEVTRAVLDGHPVEIVRTRGWPMPPLPPNVRPPSEDAAAARIVVTDETVTSDVLPTVVLNPPSLVAGMGCNRGTPASALRELLTETLERAGLAIGSLAALTSVDAKADEEGLIELAASLGVPFVTHPAEELAQIAVPNPSEAAASAVGTPSVSEASVIAQGAELVVPKQRSTAATCAIGRLPARGRLRVVGLGPGSRDLMTPRAQQAIREAEVVVGYRPYVKQVADLIRPGTAVHASGMGTEERRTGLAISEARAGKSVVLVSSGDPAVYAMASPTLEQGTEGIDVEIIPGVTASLAASAILGAPLGHDHATISLSDLHTDWHTIEKRLIAAAEGDMVTVLYNPRSHKRRRHLPRALEIFSAHRPASTPVAVVENATRPGEVVTTSTLAEFDPEWVNMNSLVVVGSSTTRYQPDGSGGTHMVTPRDYQWMNK